MVKDNSDSERRNPLILHGYFLQLAAMVLLYAQSHIQDSTYLGFCYTSCGALAGMRISSMGPPSGIDPMTHHTMSWHSTMKLHLAYQNKGVTDCVSVFYFVYL